MVHIESNSRFSESSVHIQPEINPSFGFFESSSEYVTQRKNQGYDKFRE